MTSLGLHLRKMGHSNIKSGYCANTTALLSKLCLCFALWQSAVGVPWQSWTQQGRDDEEGLQGVGNFKLGVRSAARKGKFFYGLHTFIALLSS